MNKDTTKNKNYRNINEEIKEMLVEYKSSTSETQRNESMKKILELCKPLKYYIINRLKYKPPITMDELSIEGDVLIYQVIEDYKPSETVNFSTYLTTYLKNNLTQYIWESQNAIHIPYLKCVKNGKIRKFRDNYSVENNGEEPTTEQYLEAGFTKDELQVFNDANARAEFKDIDELAENGEEQFTEDEYQLADTFEESELLKFKNDLLIEAINELKPAEKDTILRVFVNGETIEQIAKDLGMRRESIWYRYKNALNKIKKYMAV